MSEAEPPLDFDVLAANVGVQVNLARRALWLRVAGASSRRLRRPSGYLSTLVMIGANPGVSQKRLAEALILDAGALGDIVDRLEREQLVERRRDPADRRRVQLHLTPRGAVACAEARALNLEQDKKVRAALSDAEATQLIELLQRLRRDANG